MKRNVPRTVIFIFSVASLFLGGCMKGKGNLAPMVFEYELEEAESLVRQNHHRQAIDELTMLIKMDPKQIKARFLRALANQKLERFENAVSDYEMIMKLQPKHKKSHFNLGMIYAYQIVDHVKALDHLDRFLSLDPNHEEAFAVAKVMMNLDPNTNTQLIPGLQVLVRSAQKKKSVAARRKVLEDGFKSMPQSPVFPYLLAQSYLTEGSAPKDDDRKAKKFLAISIENRPTCGPCHREMGQLLLKKGKKRQAKVHLKKAELFDPFGRGSL